MRLAAVIADVHISHTPPACRQNEPDWYAAMEKVFQQVSELVGDLPLLCAGDLFDRSDPPPSLINFALDVVPYMYAIPGQHDLPWHGMDRLHASAFATLLKAKRISLLKKADFGDFVAHGFPWNAQLRQLANKKKLSVAVVHHYCWIRGKKHPMASPEGSAKHLAARLAGYDSLVFGDNHIPFSAQIGKQFIYNTGSLFRRAIDQEDHIPSVGFLLETGEIERVFLSTEGEKFQGRLAIPEAEAPSRRKIEQVVADLVAGQEVENLDYVEAVRQCANQEKNPEVASFLREILDANTG